MTETAETPDTPKPAAPPSNGVVDTGIITVFNFRNAPDRNLRLIWSGSLPSPGHIIQLHGRTDLWQVVEVVWMLNVQRVTKILERGVVISLEEVVEG